MALQFNQIWSDWIGCVYFIKESKLNLLEEMNVQKFLVLKKENEDGPDIKGGHLDALIIHATKVEKISENGELNDQRWVS